MRKITIFILLFDSISLLGQQVHFAKSYFNASTIGYYEFGAFVELADSGFILAGTYSPIPSGPFTDKILKLNKNGDSIFTRTYLTPGHFGGIDEFNDSNIVAVGGFNLNGYQINIMNLNVNSGDTSGFREYGYYQQGYSGLIKKCSDGGYILANPVSLDFGIIKLDSFKNVQWHSWSNMISCRNISQDPFGGFIACGINGPVDIPYNVLSLDDSGNTRWQRSYGYNPFNYDYYAHSVVTMEDSNYLVSCEGFDCHLMKLDRNNGDTLWTKITNSFTGITSLVSVGNDHYLGLGQTKLYLFNNNGDTVWTKDYPWPLSNFWPYLLKKTKDAGYAYCGFYCPTGNSNYRLPAFVKTDSLGNAFFTAIYDTETDQFLKIYPNPANDKLFFNYNNFMAGSSQIQIINLQGETILKKQIAANDFSIDVLNIPNGIYIAELRDKTKVVRGKVIVQH